MLVKKGYTVAAASESGALWQWFGLLQGVLVEGAKLVVIE